MDFLINLLVDALVAGLIYWLLSLLPIPDPIKKVVLAIWIVICIIALLGMFAGAVPMRHYYGVFR
jgi:hypothetical protein